jgi:hypothetical protein
MPNEKNAQITMVMMVRVFVFSQWASCCDDVAPFAIVPSSPLPAWAILPH